MKRKPYNLKYTDLCIYIDKTVYNRDENNNPIGLRELSEEEIEKVYNYLYNIIFALSMRKKYLPNRNDYESFCIETAGTIYMRLTSKKQDFTSQADSYKPIKSILNYIKTALPFMVTTWRQTNYAQILSPEINSSEELESAKNYLYEEAQYQFEEQKRKAYEDTYYGFSTFVDKALNQSIFKKNKLQRYYLTLSEYLTILNRLTVENKFDTLSNNRKLNKVQSQVNDNNKTIVNYSTDPIITDDLIDLQLRKTFFLLEDEQNKINNDYTPSDTEINNIIATNFPSYGRNQKEDD